MKFLIILLVLADFNGSSLQGATLENMLKQAEKTEDPIKREKLKKRLIEMHTQRQKFVPPDYDSKST